MLHRHCLLALALAGGVALPAQATLTHNATGLAVPHQTVTFESVALAANTPVTTQFASLGVSFTSAYGNPDPSEAYPNITGNRLGNFQSGVTQSGLFTMSFATPLFAVAFALVTAPGTTTFQALLGGVVVETAMASTSAADNTNYYAFSGIVFDRVTVSVLSSDRAFVMDNLQIATVPEPASAALLLLGMGVLLQRRTARLTG